jgi:thioredoxin 1
MDNKEIENLDLDKLLENDKVIILEFYTSWCPTCKMVAMTLEEYEEENDDALIFQISADEYKQIAQNFKVTTAPTLIFIYNKEIKNKHHGFIEVEEIKEIVSEILA